MTSKKSKQVLENSTVNFILGSTLLIFPINNFDLSFSLCHKKNMSTLYLHQKTSYFHFFTYSSNSSINKMLCRFENLVPIAALPFCWCFSFLNVNTYLLNTSSAKSIMVSIETYFLVRLLSRFFNPNKLLSCST